MILSRKVLEKFFSLLLVFLIPTQLAYHFWPTFAFVYGIRVDYLAPAIYLTDTLFITLFVYWTITSGKNIFYHLIKKNKLFLIGLFLVAVVNVIFSSSSILSLLKWFKLVEVAAFAFYVSVRKDIFSKRPFSITVFCSLIFFALLGIFQVIKGGTLGGIFYFLGERSFNIMTPGIALGKIGETVFLRAYSTFSHPNALAGYLVVGTLLFLGNLFPKPVWVKILGFVVIFLGSIMAFSFSSFIGLVICISLFLIHKVRKLQKKILPLLTLLFFGVSLIFSILSKPVMDIGINFSQSTIERLELANVAGKIISSKYLFGIGLNTFIPNEVKIIGINSYLWLLQPVHNIYLLVISELGIIGGLVLYFILYKALNKSFVNKNIFYFLAIIFIMVTGLFDHYWFTLQQNLLLFGLLIGKSLTVET